MSLIIIGKRDERVSKRLRRGVFAKRGKVVPGKLGKFAKASKKSASESGSDSAESALARTRMTTGCS